MDVQQLIEPIYRSIEERKYKNAISLCDKKKLAPFDVVQALKAHCLERLNKHDEALAICHVVMKNKPTDDRALHILPIVLRQCGALLEELIPVYAHAFRISKREEVGQLLFFAHVRAFEFQQQQQVALQLYKLTGERKFVYWSGLSILMQVTFRQTPEKMLDLAIKMVEKVVRESRESSSESLMLLLDLQLARGYVEAAWSTYTTYINHESSRSGSSSPELQQVKDNKPKPRAREGEAGYEGEEVSLGPMQRLDRLVLGAKLASRLGQWTEASRLYRELLSEHNGDDWMFLLGYVRAMMEHTEDLEEVRLFILELQTKCPTNRGPHLILCELVKDNPSALSAALEQYMERFGAKSCCFSDLRQYLDRIKESSEPFVQYLNARAEAHRLTSVDEGTEEEGSEQPGAKHRQVRIRLTCVKILRYLKLSPIPTPTDLVLEYVHTLQLVRSTQSDQREVQLGDDFLLLAVHGLLDQYHGANDVNILLLAATLLEFGLHQSAYNFQMKLCLIAVYQNLGATAAAYAWYETLEIKQVLLDSLSYVILDSLLLSSLTVEARELCSRLCSVHEQSAVDTPEAVVRAYKLGVYSKAREVTEFQLLKMKRSHQWAIAQAEGQAIALVESTRGSLVRWKDQLTTHKSQKKPEEEEEEEEPERAYAANQDRTIRISWTRETYASVDFWPRDDADDADFVYLDRSMNTSKSREWIHLLRDVVPELFLTVLEHMELAKHQQPTTVPTTVPTTQVVYWKHQAEALSIVQSLTKQHEQQQQHNVVGEKGSDDDAKDILSQCWTCFTASVTALGYLLSPTSESSTNPTTAHTTQEWWTIVAHTMTCILKSFMKMASSRVRSDEHAPPRPFSPYDMALFSSFFAHSGHWTCLCLSLGLTLLDAGRKKKKKKSQFKHQCHDLLVSCRDTIVKELHALEQVFDTLVVQDALAFDDHLSSGSLDNGGETPTFFFHSSDDFVKLKTVVSDKVRSSQRTFCDRVKTLLAQTRAVLMSSSASSSRPSLS